MAAAPTCLPCGGGGSGIKQQTVSGGAGGGVSMRRETAVQRTWVVTCPGGEPQEFTGDKAAHDAAAKCGGSMSPKM